MTENHTPGTIESSFIADHPVLEMLNSVSIVDGHPVDHWQSDVDVLSWLERVGIKAAQPSTFENGAILDSARLLRETVRLMVVQRKGGEHGDPSVLNEFLYQAASHPRLVWNQTDEPRIERVSEHLSPAQLLSPLSEQAADLICYGDFELIRECEHPDCTLWFYDRTKSHRRRWCSMAVCGNRHKVAEHRKRQRQA